VIRETISSLRDGEGVTQVGKVKVATAISPMLPPEQDDDLAAKQYEKALVAAIAKTSMTESNMLP
jgi:hypothetical protein